MWGGGAEYIIIAKEGLVLVSASDAPHEGQKHIISNFAGSVTFHIISTHIIAFHIISIHIISTHIIFQLI